MYANKNKVDRRVDAKTAFEYSGPINLERSVYIADHKEMSTPRIDSKKKLAIKIVPLGDNYQLQASQQAIIRKLFSSSTYYMKPQSYDIKDGNLYYIMKLQHMSLQSLLWIYRKEKKNMSKEFIRQFTIRMFQGLARLKPSDIFPQNIKPSNLFLQQRERGQKNWVWSEAGIQSNKRSQYYYKINMQMQSSRVNNNIKVDPLQMQFYSLGVILLEMITLQPVQQIDKVIRSGRNWDDIKNYREAAEYYGKTLISIIHNFVEPPKDNSLNKAIQDYKQFAEDDAQQDLQIGAYYLTQQRVQGYFKNNILKEIQDRAKEFVAQKNCSAKEVFDTVAKLDPQYAFGMNSIQDFEQFLNLFGIKLAQDQLLFVSNYYCSKHLIRYFKVLQKLFSAQELIEVIIVKAVDNYDSFKDFFEAQTNGRDFWKAQQLKMLLDALQAPFQQKQIFQAVKAWTGSDKATSIKYDQLYKKFKPILGMSMSLSTFKKTKTEHSQVEGQSPLKNLMEKLIAKQPDLVSFFRKHDLKQNWIVGPKIQKILQNFVKMDSKQLKKAFTEMWQKGSIPGDLSKQINYIYLIRNMQLYDSITLLRYILTQKINESDKNTFFDKYKKQQKGWTFHSFIDFNLDQNLQFQQRELKVLFKELDTDNSGTLSANQLFFKLTGLKEFDYESIVEQIRSLIDRQGLFLFEDFSKVDPKARLVLGQVNQLSGILDSIGLSISEDHLGQLYQKFSRSGKFEYLSFLHQFYSPDRLFIAATKFVLKIHYRNDFQKLYMLGLRQGRKKWNRKSLALVNEDLILGFRQIHLGKIWDVLDPNSEGSLTKQEVAEIFRYSYEQAEQLTYKPVQSIHDVKRNKKTEKEEIEQKSKNTKGIKQKQKNIEQNLIEQFRNIGQKRLTNLPLHFLRVSENKNGKITQENCIKILQEANIKTQRSQMIKVLTRFKQEQGGRRVIINYVAFYFYVLDMLYRQQFPKYLPKFKANACIALFKQIKKAKDISLQQIFKWCKKPDMMRFSDFQEVVKQLFQVDVYSADLEEAWEFLGDAKYLTIQDVDRILETNEYRFSPSKNQKKNDQQRNIRKTAKFGEKNRMSQFISGQQEIQTPYLKNVISFGDKQLPLQSQQQRKGNTIRDSARDSGSDSRGQRQLIKKGRFGKEQQRFNDELEPKRKIKRYQQRFNDELEPKRKIGRQQERFHNQLESKRKFGRQQEKSYNQLESKRKINRQQERSYNQLESKRKISRQQDRNYNQSEPKRKVTPFGSSKPKEQKIQIEEMNQRSRAKKVEQKIVKSSKTKAQLFQILKNKMQENGDDHINELFSRVNITQAKKLIGCLTIHYNFEQVDATALAQHLATFGKIKVDSLRTQISKFNSPPKERQQQKSKKKKDKSKFQPQQQEKKRQSPSKSQLPDKQAKRIIDPRRQKVNIPMVRQHIRMLVTTFCKRFQISQFQGFFFEDRDSIERKDFVSKCQSISNTFTGTISDRIFDYLKPDTNDRIGILSFKLGMGLEQPLESAEEDYLPQQLEKQLKIVFQKADKDHSGFIQPNQIQGLLSSLGFNQNIKEIENYFARLDQNFDNRISYSQFRHFIQDQILPQISNFDQEEQELQQMLKNNDIFRTGSISAPTFQAVIQRYGVKSTLHEVQIIVRALNPQGGDININQFLTAVREPSLFNGKIRGILYKIRLRKKVQLKQVQKIFENISSCFVLAYSSSVILRQILNISSPFKPNLHQSGLFYNDLSIKDVRKIGQSEQGILGGQLSNNDILVEILLKQVSGVPIPQKPQIKNNITLRYLNISIFDLSAEMMKYAVWKVEAEWDPQVEDVWRFGNNLRSIIVKVAGYDARKFEKMVVLFELVIAVVEGSRTLEINCGCANLPLRELLIPDGKVTKRLKLIAGLPNRSKEIDKASISKRSGWKNFFGGDVQSEMQLELVHQNKFKQLHKMIWSMPAQAIFNRKALHYLWTYRQFIAESAYDGGLLNNFLATDIRVLTFLLSLDIPELFSKVWLWWKDKVQSKIKTLKESKTTFRILMQELYLIVNAKQFELLRKCPTKPQYHNKSLQATRYKMISEVFDNIQNWLNTKGEGTYKRKKNYNFSYGPLQLHEVNMPREHIAFMESLTRLLNK